MLRWAMVLLFALLAIASRFGLDVVLGAMLAGMVLRRWTRRMDLDTTSLEHKFDTVGYGIFIPIFFITAMTPRPWQFLARTRSAFCAILFGLLLTGPAAGTRCWSTGEHCSGSGWK